jgi:hypothetical protein
MWVPTQSSGTDQPVLVRKLVKANGAKGLSYPVLQIGFILIILSIGQNTNSLVSMEIQKA